MTMYFLHTADGTSIVAKHVVTVSYGVETEAYQKDAFAYWKAELDIRNSPKDSEQEERLKAALATAYPKGRPEITDYARTKVGLVDGKTYWVVERRDDVIRAVLEDLVNT